MATTVTPSKTLSERDLRSDPIDQFKHWFAEAEAASILEPNAMTLATTSPEGVPSARIVLMKDVTRAGFLFFTNYASRKGNDIAANSAVALLFHWSPLDRQVRIEGTANKIPRAESEAYFQSRPRGSQVSTVISHQSQVVGSRSDLETRARTVGELYKGQPIPCPAMWGGYLVAPHTIEFWQGRENRLHDRLAYRLQPNGLWIVKRLSP